MNTPTAAAASSSSRAPVIDRSTLTATQLLNALLAHLGPMDATDTLLDSVTALEATCWNWALHGAAAATHASDANWAYLYVSSTPHGDDAATHDAIAGRNPVALVYLDEARALWDEGGRLTLEGQDRIQLLVLRALVAFNGLVEAAAGGLQLVLYDLSSRSKADGLMSLHFEFVYEGRITVTKGNGDHLRAFNGKSGFPKGKQPRSVLLGVDPTSLKLPQVTAVRDLVRQTWDS